MANLMCLKVNNQTLKKMIELNAMINRYHRLQHALYCFASVTIESVRKWSFRGYRKRVFIVFDFMLNGYFVMDCTPKKLKRIIIESLYIYSNNKAKAIGEDNDWLEGEMNNAILYLVQALSDLKANGDLSHAERNNLRMTMKHAYKVIPEEFYT